MVPDNPKSSEEQNGPGDQASPLPAEALKRIKKSKASSVGVAPDLSGN